MSERLCFVIAPIGEADSDTRKRSDQVLKHVIGPAVCSLGYRAIRADQISEPGIITSQVIQHIVDDPLVIADLTERNPNVFYELAIRHAIRKPLVQLIRSGEQIPFDIAGTRTIHIDHHDLDSVEDAKREIQAQVTALEQDSSRLETPISVALDMQVLRASGNPEARSLGDVLAAVTEIRTTLAGVEERLKRQDPTQTLLLRELFGRRDDENEHMKARLQRASIEVRDAIRQIALLSDTPDAGREKTFSEILSRLENVVAVLPDVSVDRPQ